MAERDGERGRAGGFTLLELLVVLAVVGILAATAMAAYAEYRKRAFEASAIGYLRSWVAAQELYLQRYGHYADADEQLAEQGMGVLRVPKDLPYNFHIDSDSSQTEHWYGRATPKIAGLAHLYIDETGVVLRSLSGPPSP